MCKKLILHHKKSARFQVKSNRLYVLIPYLISFLLGFSIAGYQFALSDMSIEFGMGASGMGVIATARAIGMVVLPLAVSAVADKLPKSCLHRFSDGSTSRSPAHGHLWEQLLCRAHKRVFLSTPARRRCMHRLSSSWPRLPPKKDQPIFQCAEPCEQRRQHGLSHYFRVPHEPGHELARALRYSLCSSG